MVETDPNGIKQGAPGCKLDAGKVMANLLLDFRHALLAVAEVATYGAGKYSRGGWRYVPDGYDRYTGAMLRHLLADTPDESGLDHDYMVAWNALSRLELKLNDKTASKDIKQVETRVSTEEFNHCYWRNRL